ncbi:MAG: Dna2/Cas4 domain-containing protein, partial [Nitrososphaerales archaeon]
MSSKLEIATPSVDREAKFTGSQINYYFICKRKLWLFSHNIELEQESDLVKLGALLHQNRYRRKM